MVKNLQQMRWGFVTNKLCRGRAGKQEGEKKRTNQIAIMMYHLIV